MSTRVPSSRLLLAVGALSFAPTGAGCHVFEGLTLDPSVDAGPSGSVCVSITEPGPPRLTDENATAVVAVPTVTVAVGTSDPGVVDHGSDVQRYRKMGFDLDGVCTGLGDAGPSCFEPWWAKADHTDGPGGRDNALGMDLYMSDSVYTGNTDLTMVIRVRGYNGAANAEHVDVAFLVAHFSASAERSRPLWDGNDVWNAIDQWVPDGGTADSALFHDPDGYVTNGVLVAHLPRLLVGGDPVIPLVQAIVTARIVKDADGGWVLRDGTAAGRVRVTDLLAVPRNASGQPVCDSVSYEAIKANVCSYADIRASVPNDPSAPCDALSWAWQFDNADPVRLRGVVPLPILNTCAGGPVEVNGTCETLHQPPPAK
jgi:hypothetical protein